MWLDRSTVCLGFFISEIVGIYEAFYTSEYIECFDLTTSYLQSCLDNPVDLVSEKSAGLKNKPDY